MVTQVVVKTNVLKGTESGVHASMKKAHYPVCVHLGHTKKIVVNK
jgi:hypothetical protein